MASNCVPPVLLDCGNERDVRTCLAAAGLSVGSSNNTRIQFYCSGTKKKKDCKARGSYRFRLRGENAGKWCLSASTQLTHNHELVVPSRNAPAWSPRKKRSSAVSVNSTEKRKAEGEPKEAPRRKKFRTDVRFRVSVAQVRDLSVYEPGENAVPSPVYIQERVAQINKLAALARADGSSLLLFPELFLSGYGGGEQRLRARAVNVGGPEIAQICAVARTYAIALCVPYAEVDVDGALYNSAVLADRSGRAIANYRKTHLFSGYETALFTPGNELSVVQLSVGDSPDAFVAVGILICMDIEYPEPARVLRLKGAEVLLMPTALCQGPVAEITPLCTVPTRALENHFLLLYSNFHDIANATGGERQFVFCGRSAVIAPNGIALIRGESSAGLDTVLTAEYDASKYQADVDRNPYLRDRRPELYDVLLES